MNESHLLTWEFTYSLMSTCSQIFLILIFAKNLIWEFSAETIAILTVEVIVACMTLKKVHRGIDAVIILSLYPLSMALVAILENAARA